MPEVLVSNEAFRRKARLALRLWARQRPSEVRTFLTDAEKSRSESRSGGFDKGRDLAFKGMLPAFVVDVLKMSEWQTSFQYGVPCGTGDSDWDLRPGLRDALLDELPAGRVSGHRGESSRRGWS